jgi:hypothetical protein
MPDLTWVKTKVSQDSISGLMRDSSSDFGVGVARKTFNQGIVDGCCEDEGGWEDDMAFKEVDEFEAVPEAMEASPTPDGAIMT